MTHQFRGGLEWPGKLQRVSGPWILMTATGSSIEFSMRFRWLRRFFGPWRVERAAVREVYVTRMGALAPWTRVRILGQENMPWCFLTQRPYEVLGYLERLGYPVSSTSKH